MGVANVLSEMQEVGYQVSTMGVYTVALARARGGKHPLGV